MPINKNIFIRDILQELEGENVAVFAGAGLSMPAGYVGWEELLKPIAEELNIDIKKEYDLVSLAQYYLNENGGHRSELNRRLIEVFTQNTNTTENHKILAKLPIKHYWTTNYDKLIEQSIEEQFKKVDVKYTKKHLSITIPKRDAIIYKMHGDISSPDDAILTKDDYESYHVKMDLYLSTLKGDLLNKTFIFLGFSFTDPNLDYILSRVRLAGISSKRHFNFTKKVTKKADEDLADFEYRKRKQELFIGDLKRFNIKTILVDDYNDITNILKEVEEKFKRKNIFISGAAHEYGEWGRDKSEKFVHDLSKKLIENDFKIVSGYGLGIGSSVISGSLNAIYNNPKKYSKDELILRPFPQSVQIDQDIKKLWTQYRKDMIDYAGIAIFIFGNKIEDGEIVLSNGMKEELEIAKEKNLLLIPIGSTGYISELFWNELKEENSESKIYEELGDKNKEPKEIIDLILDFLKSKS
ncbi:SIR2 family protein [Aliarcobacter butzleri]|uniref:SIR2 family protein n=1 Tax=Aliarcobacter butzleri TaxID=28197 RepID=UPI003BAFD24B